jgi:UDP-glucose 4-epimerase
MSSFFPVLAMTGASGFLGSSLLKKWVSSPHIKEIHVFDCRIPNLSSSKIVFHLVDLCADNADTLIASVLLRVKPQLFLHAALFSAPHRKAASAREIESIGTFHLLNALAEAKTSRLVIFSHTFVYGASAHNPNFISEHSSLKGTGPQFVRTRVDVERQIQEFSKDYAHQCKTCVLRFAPVFGPTSDHLFARYFMAGVVPKPLGFDPLLQFVHEDDALRAAQTALFSDKHGIFNIVGKGVIPLSTAIHLAGKIPFPVPSFICRSVFSAGFALRLWELPSDLVDFYQYLCVADGHKAREFLEFTPTFSSRQALKSMIEAQRLRDVGFSVPSSVLGEEMMASTEGFSRVP